MSAAPHLRLAATHYENFPVGSWLLPRAERRHLHRIYAFARTADDLADELRSAPALADFRADFERHLTDPSTRSTPLLRDLCDSIVERELPSALFFDLLDAFALDLRQSRHDRQSLLAYCTKSADPVGRLVLRVFGHRDDEMDRLSDLVCTGLQLVNHLQDVREDWLERDRVYFPVEDFARHGVALEALAGTSTPAGLRDLLRGWADETRAMLRDGHALTGMVRGRLAAELRAILGGAGAVLRSLAAIDYDVLKTHVRLTRREKIAVVARALFRRRAPVELR